MNEPFRCPYTPKAGQNEEPQKNDNNSSLPSGHGSVMIEKWIDAQDILMRLPISRKTLQRWRKNKLLPYSRIGSKIFYREADVQDMLMKHLKR